MKTNALQLTLALLCLIFAHQLSYADGFFIPPARKKVPDIPVQRALIKYRGGTESLVIESTLGGEGGYYGWIIPVPGPPKKLERVSPGLLKTVSFQIQPKIHHEDLHEELFGSRIMSIFTILTVITCCSIMRWGARAGAVALPLLMLSLITLPNFISYRSSPVAFPKANPPIKITNREIVGDYEVFVLEVQDSSVLNSWLEKNGYSKFQPEAIKIIDDYISHDWVFAVAKLRTVLGGTATPHPILLEFDTDKPVYPMRLTAIPGSTVYLELFVTAEKEAIPVNYNLQKEYCNFFDFGKIPRGRFNPLEDQPGFIPRKFLGLFMEIAHSDASKVMWDGCVLTKFSGKLSSDQMIEDMFFVFKDPNPFRSELYSSLGAYNKAYYDLLIILICGSIVLTIYYRSRKRLGIKVSIIKLFILLFLVSAIGFGLSYVTVGEKVDVHPYSTRGYWHDNLQVALFSLFSEPDIDFSNGSEFVELLKKDGINNPVTGEPIIIENSPGNIIFEETADEIVIKVCLENGSLYTLF